MSKELACCIFPATSSTLPIIREMSQHGRYLGEESWILQGKAWAQFEAEVSKYLKRTEWTIYFILHHLTIKPRVKFSTFSNSLWRYQFHHSSSRIYLKLFKTDLLRTYLWVNYKNSPQETAVTMVKVCKIPIKSRSEDNTP